MFCFSKNCNKPTFGDFTCFCGRQKFFCEEHVNGMSDVKKSCELGGKCMLCKKPPIFNHLKFIKVYSDENVPFLVCDECAIEEVDQWVSEYIKEEKENLIEIYPARDGSHCDICNIQMVAQRRNANVQDLKKCGWVWNDGYFKYRYCIACIGKACMKAI